MRSSALNKMYFIFTASLCSLIAVALQCQIKLFQSESYFGLRINLADLILPFAGLFIVTSLLKKQSYWPKWREPFNLLWPIALCAVIGFSLLYSYVLHGEVHSWALINKGLGWFILMAYLASGAWLSTNFDSSFILKFFARPFLLAFIIIAAGYTLFQTLIISGIIDGYQGWLNMSGLMGNRNAFAFLLLTCAALSLAILSDRSNGFNTKLATVFWAFLPACLLLNGSRTLWIIFTIFALYVLVVHAKTMWRNTFLPALIGFCAFLILAQPLYNGVVKIHYNYSSNLYAYSKTFLDKQDLEEKDLTSGDHMRLSVYKSALRSWREHPVLGSGLGGSLIKQEEENGKAIVVVHNTILWLLTDTGLIGVCVFLWVYIVMLRSFLKTMQDKNIEKKRQNLAHAGLLMLLIFGLFSLFHEMLYMRFMWFILGLALAAPIQALRQNEDPAPQKTL